VFFLSGNNESKKVRIKTLCLSDDSGGYAGKKGQVEYQQLALLDQSDPPEARMLNSFDLRLVDAADRVKYAGKCLGKVVIVDAKDFEVFNSRLKIKTGRIVEVVGLNSK
jgi:hypothetical protein